MFNSGQSCCAIEVGRCHLGFLRLLNSLSKRIYVHESMYDEFVAQYVDLVKVTVLPDLDSCEAHIPCQKKYVLGDPTKPETSLGPVVSVASAEKIRKQVVDAGEDSRFPYRLVDFTMHIVKAGATALIPEDLFLIAQP